MIEVGTRGVPCSNEVFGDPAEGIPKRCAYMARGYGRSDGREPGYDRRGAYGGGRHERYREPVRAVYRDSDDGYGAPSWRTSTSCTA